MELWVYVVSMAGVSVCWWQAYRLTRRTNKGDRT